MRQVSVKNNFHPSRQWRRGRVTTRRVDAGLPTKHRLQPFPRPARGGDVFDGVHVVSIPNVAIITTFIRTEVEPAT